LVCGEAVYSISGWLNERNVDVKQLSLQVRDELLMQSVFLDIHRSGELFGGEAISTVNYQRDGLEKVLGLLDKWIESVISIGFDTVFLDEPHAGNETLKFITSIYQKYKDLVHFYVCFCDDTFTRLTDKDIIRLPIKNVGLSAYFWTNDDSKIEKTLRIWIARLLKLRPNNHHIWIQGFDLPKGCEHVPVLVYNIAKELGVKNFGFWAYKSAEATSAKRAINYKFVWKQTCNLFNNSAEIMIS